jgi:hypothetical protein
LAQSITYPITNKYIRRDINSSFPLAKPIDYEALKKNDEFINMVNTSIKFREGGIIFLKGVMEKLETLISDIDKELNSR